MKFLIDVNTSRHLASCLVDMGHDVTCVADEDVRMSDEHILTYDLTGRVTHR